MTRSVYSDDGRVHILMSSGHYLGQLRWFGYQKWRTVTGKCRSSKSALAQAVRKMGPNDHRARVLMIDSNPYYEPHVTIEAKRR